MTKTGKKNQIRRFLLRIIGRGRDDVAGLASARYGVTRQYVNKLLRDLTNEGSIEATGKTRARTYGLARETRNIRLEIDDTLEEDRVWRQSVRGELEGIGSRALEICHTGFTEMFNNVLDHSEGTGATVTITRTPVAITLRVGDDGVGIFQKIQDAFGLEDPEHAVLELSKGKLTTDPDRHTGEGIFFTSRMFDEFRIVSGKLALIHRREGDDWLIERRQRQEGTAVSMTIDPDTRRSTRAVYDRYTAGEGGDYGFNVTHVPVGLARYGEENLVSRSQAKRVLARLELFKKVVLNFSGVTTIGQAFADEMFRVYPREQPDLEFVVVNATADVRDMIRRSLAQSESAARIAIVE